MNFEPKNENEMYVRLGINEEKIKTIQTDVDKLKEDNQILKEIATTVKLQREDSVRREQAQSERDMQQNQQTEKLTEAINGINSNILILNNGHNSLREDFTAFGKRVEKIEDSSRVNVLEWIKNIAYALVLAGMLIFFGLK